MSLSPTLKMEAGGSPKALPHLRTQQCSWSLLWACPVSLNEVRHIQVNFISYETIIHKALLLMTDRIILLILCSYLLLAFWSWMKEGNIMVSVHMGKAGALTRLSGWKTEGSCCDAQRGQGLSSLQHPDWLWGAPSLLFIGDFVLVVCGHGMKLTAWYLQHLHNSPPPLSLSITVYVLIQQWEAYTLSPTLALMMMIMPWYTCK
jgi:hypothetical protein